MSTENLQGSTQGITAQVISSKLQDASDPLSFIKQNLRKEAPIQATEVPESRAEIVPVVDPRVKQAVSEPSFKEAIDNIDFPFDAPSAEPDKVTPEIKPQEEVSEEQPQAKEELKENSLLDLVDKKKVTKEDSMREARKKIGELNLTLTQKDELARELEEKIKKYETGEAIPDIIREKENRIAGLEKYEKLHNLRVSPEYQDKYVKPLAALSDKATQIANDYQIDPEILNQAITIENKKDQNEFLRRHFDDVGALEVRNVLDDIKNLTIEAERAEQEPQQAFQRLQEDAMRANAQREQQRVSGIQKTAREGWIEALTDIRTQGQYPELTMTGDPENDKYVKPILEEASKEYAKFVQFMGVKRMEELPPQAAKILAQRFLLAQATSVAMASRSHHYERSQELLKNTERRQSLVRPAVGSGHVTTPQAAPRPRGVEAAADALLSQVMNKR